MIATTFNHIKISEDYVKGIEQRLPVDFTESSKCFILDIVKRFSIMTGDAFALDVTPFNTYSEEQKTFGIQIIAEWTFHKALELIPSKIKPEKHEDILRKVAFETFEIIKKSYEKNIKPQIMLEHIEKKVNKTFDKACK